jgi:hypothetical protein
MAAGGPTKVRIRAPHHSAGARLCLKDQPQRVHKRVSVRIRLPISVAFGALRGSTSD